MKHVCFIQPPQPQSIDDLLNPSMSLLFLAGYIKQFNYEVSYCELSGTKGSTDTDFYKEFRSKIPQADVYGITFYTPSYSYIRLITKVIKDQYPNAKIVVGGPHPSALPEDSLAIEGVDAVIQFEGELALLKWLDNGCPRGIFSLEINTQARDTHPLRSLIDYSNYTKMIGGVKCVDVITSRGCPWNCSFCFKCSLGKSVKFNSLEWSKEDIRMASEISNRLLFLDDVFTLRREDRLYPLLDYMKELCIIFRAHAKPGYNNLEDFKRMKDSGCDTVAIGVETGSEELLRLMNKGVVVQQNAQCLKDLREAEILSRSYFISMFPGETQHTIDETLKFVDDYKPDQFSIFTCTILPGTDMYINPEKYGITWISKDWNDYQFVFGNDGIGGCNFETKSMKRDKMIELNKFFVNEMMKKKQNGVLPSFYNKLKWSKI